MAKRVPFINRENELAQIEKLIQEQNTQRALCIHAPGGIGKTRLLQEVQERYAKEAFITKIIDFDNLALRIPANIELAVARQIGQKAFNAYLSSLQTYHQARREGTSPGRLAQKRLEARQAFIDDFNEFSIKQRVVILLDTTDTLEGTDAWNYVVDVLSRRLKNLLLIVAGRNAKNVYRELRSGIKQDARLIELPPLDEGASELYLRQKQELLHSALEPELAKRLLLLAGGRPILIDLAVEWLAREIPIEWMIKSSLKELKSLSGAQMDERREEFERQLISHIAQIRTPMDRLTLVMSRTYPLDGEMISELLQVPEDKAALLFEDAKTYVFVKSLPDGRISLHDEMRRMVEERLWLETDPGESRRRRDSELTVAYLERKAQTIQAQIDQYEVEEQTRPQQDMTADPFSEQEILKQQLWTLQARALHHSMYLNPNQGFEKFDGLILKASNKRHSDRCIMLKETAERHRDSLSKENQARLDLSERLLSILEGDLDNAINLIRNGLRRLEAINATEDLDRFYNSLGYCYRLQGKWDLAIESYEQALEYSRRESDARQIAETMNNIANVCRFNGDFERGLRYTKLSLKIREKLDDKLSIANTCYVRGMISWEIGNTYEAANYLNRAKELYQELGDQVRAAWVDKYIGYFHYRIGDVSTTTVERLEQAAAIFAEHKAKGDLADTLNMLSRVTRRSGITELPLAEKKEIFQEAEEYALEGQRTAQEVGDNYRIAECNLTLCLLYYRWSGEYYQTRETHAEAEKYYEQAQKYYEQGFPIARDNNYSDLLSVYHMAAGNVAYDEGLLAYHDGDEELATRKWDDAFEEHYLEECRISAGYKEARFDRALSEVATRLMKLPDPKLTYQYCDFLIRGWERRGLNRQYPQLLAECEQIKEFMQTPEASVVSQLSEAQMALFTMGDWQGTVKAGQQVLQHNRVYPHNPDVVRTLNASAFALRQQGHFFEARRLCTQSLHIGEQVLAKRLGGQSFAEYITTHKKNQIDRVKQALSVVAESHYVMGTIHWIVGNTAEAATHLRLARTAFEKELEDDVGAARVHRYEGFLYYRIGNLKRSLELLEKARACFEENQERADLIDVLTVQSRVLRESKQYKAARKATEQANEIAQELDNYYVVAETLINLYLLNSYDEQISRESGNQEKVTYYSNLVRQCFDEGFELARRFGYDLLISVYEQFAGDAAFQDARRGPAFEHYVAALKHGARFEYTRLHRSLDACIDRLVQLPENLIRYYADYVIREWKDKDLDAEFPDVVNMFELAKRYRAYVSQA